MLKEFKDFAIKGNVIDMAVGIIIGTAFGKIVTSLVSDLIMPPIGWLTGGVDFSNLQIILKPATEETDAVSINYGMFLNNVLNFLIIAFTIFFVIKQMNRLREKFHPQKAERESQKEDANETAEQTKLLREIRDHLKNHKN